MSKTNLYLAYGSNLNLRQMKFRCPGAKIIGKTELENYILVFRGSNLGAVATVEKCEGFQVPVLIWQITEKDEISLDRYEGYPNFYRKEYVDINLNGKKKTAMIYIMNEGRPINYPSRYYLNTILEGYETADFDKKIIEKSLLTKI